MSWRPRSGTVEDMNSITRHDSPASATAANCSASDSSFAAALQPMPKIAIGLIAAAAFALEMAVSGRYGYVRDELYFLASGQHLSFGYVDQPLLTPLLARISAILTGNSLVGLRTIPALAFAAVVLLTAAMSRRLGAGRTGQVLAALAAATCGQYLGGFHELTTTSPDFLFWAITLYLAVRLVRSQDPRWWLAIGLAVGVGADAKWNIGFLLVSLLAGFAATDARRLLRSRYLLIALVIAGVLACPDVIWQAMHGWPNLAVFHVLQTQAGHNRAVYWPGQILFTGLALTPIWIAGLIWTLRSERGRAYRGIAIGCAVAIVLQFVLGGKAYYPGGAYTFLLAAGCIPLERWIAARGPFGRKIQPAAATAAVMLASAALIAPAAIPVLPARVLHTVPLQRINYDLAESIAWAKQVALVARQYRGSGRQLRRGGSDRPVRAAAGPAAGLQRRQQLLAVGSAAGQRQRRHRGEPGPAAAPPGVPPRRADRHVLERHRRGRRRAGRPDLPGDRPADQLGEVLGGVPRLRLRP
jgi:hypothetical protein